VGRYEEKEGVNSMSSKPKSKTFIMHEMGSFRQLTVKGRYKVGARNEKEAEELLRSVLGKPTSVRVYYEEKGALVPHGTVMNDVTKVVLQ
jgi:2'-5' RNA ligase